MTTLALIRPVSPRLGNCELTYLERQPIDFGCAVEQQREYERCLTDLGLQVVALPPEPELPDAVFVEDTAVVVGEVAIIGRPGAEPRRAEVDSVATVLAKYRPLEFIQPPGTLDGGDVVTVNRTMVVGLSRRTNEEGADQLRDRVGPFGYNVRTVMVSGAVHLKSACTSVGNGTLLVNPAWIDTSALDGFDLLAVPTSEPWAANAILVGETIVMAAGFPETREQLERSDRTVSNVELSEFHKAEGGVSCLSLIFEGA